MTYVKWAFYAVLIAAVAALLHYSLPQRDIARITGQEVKRRDVTVDTGTGARTETRDVNYIYTVDTEGRERAYRNEDTDFGWPPYFKFDTADVSAVAANSVSSKDDPQWMVITHYGWRINMFSMFENVVGIREAASKDEPLYPWFNAAVITTLILVVLLIRRFLQIFYRERIEPMVESVDQEFDEASETVSEGYRGVRGFLTRLFGR